MFEKLKHNIKYILAALGIAGAGTFGILGARTAVYNLSNDSAPTLSANMDAGNFNITNVGTISSVTSTLEDIQGEGTDGTISIYDSTSIYGTISGARSAGFTSLGLYANTSAGQDAAAVTLGTLNELNEGDVLMSVSNDVDNGNGGFTALSVSGKNMTHRYAANADNAQIIRNIVVDTANITAAASVTLSFSIPSGSKLVATILRVESALAGGDTWDANWDDGATVQAIATNQAVAQNTQVEKFFDENAATAITDAPTNIVITKNGGGSFTAQGTIRGYAIYETLDIDDV